MKLLHLADIHIGRRLNEVSLIDDQRFILEKLYSIIEDEGVEAVVIAGDVYDKSAPSVEAVVLFDEFLNNLKRLNQTVFIVSGNHDSAERLSFGSSIFKESGIYLSESFSGDIQPISYGGANFYLLPFIRPVNVRTAYGNEISSFDEAVGFVLDRINLDESAVNIMITHQFVKGAEKSDSEEMMVGGTCEVDVSRFEKFDYTALGHIHRRQTMLGKIHYPGTPLKYSLSEAKTPRYASVVEINGKNSVDIKAILLIPEYDLKEIRGSFLEIMSSSSEDYAYVTLTDEDEVSDCYRELRKKYPRLMSLKYDNRRTKEYEGELVFGENENETPLELFEKLYQRQNNQAMSEEERSLVSELIEGIWEE